MLKCKPTYIWKKWQILFLERCNICHDIFSLLKNQKFKVRENAKNKGRQNQQIFRIIIFSLSFLFLYDYNVFINIIIFFVLILMKHL